MTDGIKSTELGWGEGDATATVAEKPGAIAAQKPRPAIGSYEVRELLGRGGMGEVVLADDVGIGRQVAIKRMRSDEPSDAQVARFLREAKIQARLDHPAIVPVHELGRDASGRPYFTMKRLSGTTLSEVIRTGRDTQQRMLRVFAEVCFAIDFAHARGVIHRDLKPSNVMLGDYGEVYVIDWGLARVLSPTADPDEVTLDGGSLGGETQAGAVMGTPGYMSPEQVRGETVGTAADIYALGAILFEILAGTRLHPSSEAALVATVAGGVHSPASRATDRPVPPELDLLCTRALAALPADRPTARALAEGVQHYLDGDRDLERRRALAAELLATARADVDSGDPARRADAMKHAGRALALDPESEAGALVGRLMIEPPRVLPPELEHRLGEADHEHVVVQARSAMFALSAYLVFFPINLWMGVRDWMAYSVMYVLVGLAIACTWALARYRGFRIEIALVANALLLVALSRVTSSFLVAPTLTAAAAMLFVMLPQLQHRPVIVVLMYTASFVAPIVLERVGIWDPTWHITGARFVAEPAAIVFDGVPAVVFLVSVTIAALLVLTLFVRRLAISQRAGRRQLEMQAWHLAQLIPEPKRG